MRTMRFRPSPSINCSCMYRIGSSERADLPLAVVVGAGAMGMAVARRLAQQHRVLLADINGPRLEDRVAVMRGEGCDVSGIRCDITNVLSVEALAFEVGARGGLAVLAHVAGLSPSLGDFQSILRVNLRGAALVAAALLPLTHAGSAAIFISSLAAHNFAPTDEVVGILSDPAAEDLVSRLQTVLGPERATPQKAYTLSKWGLMRMVRRSAISWGARGARIVSLSPGMIATNQGAIEFQKSEGKRRLFERTPLKREGTMLEIADAVEFLASSRASFIHGTDLLVDGGLSAAVSQA
jgi:NAD(P)-dependent dehydrogenase (short-subunit alcohol dehydrogenase family)